MGENKVKIVAAMMMKDEEENLGRCLSSIKDLVDEIVIVDTGSTDKSMDIAKNYGAIIYEHPWQEDFSLHRNQSIDYAEKHGADWIFIIDCDEEWIIQNPRNIKANKTLRQFIANDVHPNLNVNSVAVPLHDIQRGNVAMQFNTTRFYRKGHIKYMHRVHNKPDVTGEIGLYDLARLNHYGYDLKGKKDTEKKERRTRLLLKRLEENPNDYETYFYLNQDFTIRGELKQAVEYGLKYIQHKDDLKEKFRKSIYFSMIRTLIKVNDKDKAKQITDEAVQLYPDDLDINYAATEFGIWSRIPFYIKNGARSFIMLYDKYQKDPNASRGAFIFNLNPDSLAYCVYYLSIALADETMFNLNNFSNIMPIVGKRFNDTMRNDAINFIEKYSSDVNKIKDNIVKNFGVVKKEQQVLQNNTDSSEIFNNFSPVIQ